MLRIIIGVVLATIGPLVLERFMSAAPEWSWRVLAFACVVLGLAFVVSSGAIYPFLHDYSQHRIVSTVIVSACGAIIVAACWLFLVIRFNPSADAPLRNVSLAQNNADKYPTHTFWLLRERGSIISLYCPGEKCMQFELGDLKNEGGTLMQEIKMKGEGFNAGYDHKPLHGGINLLGSLGPIYFDGPGSMDLGGPEPIIRIGLQKDTQMGLGTHYADIILTVVDTRADALRIKLELKPPGALERAPMHDLSPTPPSSTRPAAPLSKEDRRRAELLAKIRSEYTSSHDNEPPSTEWIQDRLMELRESWYFTPEKPRTVYDFFLVDSEGFMSIGTESATFVTSRGTEKLRLRYRANIDFKSGSKYLSVYIPFTNSTAAVCRYLARNYDQILEKTLRGISVSAGSSIDPGVVNSDDLVCTRKVYIYYEGLLSLQEMAELEIYYRQNNAIVQFRGTGYATSQRLLRQTTPKQPPR